DPPTAPKAPPDAKPVDADAKAFLAKHCLNCHSGEKPKGDMPLDKLTADFDDKNNRARWQSVAEQLKAGTMPPEKKPRPDAKEVTALTDWVTGQLEVAEV